MRVLYVWDGEYPWDVRTEKVCLALAEHGHSVVITARNDRGRPRREERPEGVIERLPRFRFFGGSLLSFPAFCNPVWLRHLARLGAAQRPDVVMVRDLPLAPTALWSARGRPVILDMAENYPAMIADIWSDGRAGRLDLIVRNPWVVAAVERYTLPRLTHVLTVVEESKERLRAMGMPAERISVVSNTPRLNRITGLARRLPGEPLRIVYLGLMENHRGVGDVLRAAQILRDRGVSCGWDLIGDGRDYARFRARAGELGLGPPEVVFHGRLPHEEALGILGRAHVGVVPHHATESWNTTIPNKLFDYMAAGLAVVTSTAAPALRIVSETRAGVSFRSGSAADLAEKVGQLLEISTWDQYRRNGQDAIRRRYNWERDSRILLDVVDRIGERGVNKAGDA